MRVAMEPDINEKVKTPINIKIEVKILSYVFTATISPYPTVEIVVTVQYIVVTYNSVIPRSFNGILYLLKYSSIQELL